MNRQEILLQKFLDEWHKGEGISAHTSGSTGTPKDIFLPMTQVERSAERSNRFFGITRKSRLHAAMSFEFIGGKMMIARSIKSGCQLTFSEPSVELVPPEEGRPVSLISLVPAQMHYVINNLDKFGNIEKYLLGGSAIDDKLWDRIVASGVEAWESYGMTETATHIALRRIAGPSSNRPHFVPFPGVKVSLSPDNCMVIQDEETFVVTTDLAQIYDDGSFEILGRKDDVIITGGLKVMPQKIEKIIQPYVSRLLSSFYISSVPDEKWTSRLVLIGVPEKSSVLAEDIPMLVEFVNREILSIPEDKLPKRLKPKDTLIVKALPVTSSGKLKRRSKVSDII